MVASLKTRLRHPVKVYTPASHLGLTWAPSTQSDTQGVHELVVSVEAELGMIRRTPDKEIASWAKGVDPLADIRNLVGKDSEGVIHAFAAVRVPHGETEMARAELFAVTCKKWRQRGIGRALLAWQDAIAREMLIEHYGSDSTLPARIVNVVDSDMLDRRRMYVAAGFSPKRSIGVYVSDLKADPGIGPHDGIHLRPWSEDDAEEVKQIYIDAQTLAGATHLEAEQWWNRARRLFCPSMSYCAVDEDNIIHAAALTCKHSDVWLSSGQIDGAIDLIAFRQTKDTSSVEALVSLISVQAKEQGMRRLSVETTIVPADHAHLRLLRLGFQKIGSRKVYTIDV